MALVRIMSCASLPEALVVESLLGAHGIRATLIGAEMARQRWDLTIALGGIPILVSDVDAATANALVQSGTRPRAERQWESTAFKTHPIRNGVWAAFVFFVLSGIWPIWIANKRNWYSETTDSKATNDKPSDA